MENPDVNSKNESNENQDKVLENLSRIKHTIVVMSGKGGVGKTTVAANLASSLAEKGDKVGLLDVDLHGPNVPKMLGIENEVLTAGDSGIVPVVAHHNLKVISMAYLLQEKDIAVVWRGPMKIGAIKQFLGEVEWGELDYLIIDLPPGTGDEPLSIAQEVKDAHALIITTPQDVALMDARRSVSFARLVNMKILGMVENMSGLSCPHCHENIDLFKEGGGERAATDLDIPFLGKLPIEPEIVRSGDSGLPFVLSHQESQSAQAFDRIVKNISEFLDLVPDKDPSKDAPKKEGLKVSHKDCHEERDACKSGICGGH